MIVEKKRTALYYLIASILLINSEAVLADDFPKEMLKNAWVYKVNKNDSLHLICSQYCVKNTNLNQLAKLNQLSNPNLLRTGQTIEIPLALLKTIDVPVQIINAQGDVSIKNLGEVDFRKVSQNSLVYAGATLQTGINSMAKLRFADGSVSTIQPQSNLKIESSLQYAGKLTYSVKLKLIEGRTEVNANPEHLKEDRFEVETPSAVAVVRGTKFRVSADHEKAIEETLQGRVALASAEHEVAVDEDFGSIAVEGQAPSTPKALPNAPVLTEFNQQFDELPITFELNSPKEASAWVAQLAADQNFTQILNEKTVVNTPDIANNKLVYENLSTGDYFLKIRAQDAQGLQSVDAIHAFSVNINPFRPVLASPLNTALAAESPLFEWTNIPNNNGYLIQIAKDSEFKEIFIQRLVSYNVYSLKQDLPKGEYFWRVGLKKSPYATLVFSKVSQFTFQ